MLLGVASKSRPLFAGVGSVPGDATGCVAEPCGLAHPPDQRRRPDVSKEFEIK